MKEKTLNRKVKNAMRFFARRMAKAMYDPDGRFEGIFKNSVYLKKFASRKPDFDEQKIDWPIELNFNDFVNKNKT